MARVRQTPLAYRLREGTLDMSAGLPALGLGGVFYLLLIFWMVVRACSQTQQEPVKWGLVGKMSLMGVVMIAVIVCEWLLIREAVHSASAYIPSLQGATPSVSFALFLFAIPFILLGLIISSMHIICLWNSKRSKTVRVLCSESEGT